MTQPTAIAEGAWLVCQRPRPNARVRLFCFPHSGVGASVYRRWQAALPDDVEVVAMQAPGREDRIREPALTRIPAIVDGVVPAIAARLDRPFALFGHSMGGVVASEVARVLCDRGRAPAHLVVSARRAPLVPPDEPLLHTMDDDALVGELGRRYGGIPAAVARDKDLLRWHLPCLRADLTALETHAPGKRAPMPCPITVFGGTEDALTPREHLEPWKDETSGAFRIRFFEGGHFYLEPRRADVLAHLSEILA